MSSRSVLVLSVVVSAIGCGGPEPTRLPRQIEGLGSGTADCVEACRALFAECASVTVYVDSVGQSLTPGVCASDCADEAEYDASLEAAGCVAEWAAYERCVLGPADGFECSVSGCSIEWGVYQGCSGG